MSFNSDAGDNSSTCRWINWCRLCAKEDKHNISFQNLTNSNNENKKLSFQEALEKYFGVQTSSLDSFPKKLCVNCFYLVSAMINFNEHVERVQLMLSFLADMQNFSGFFDLNSVRLKFKVIDCERDYCLNSFLLINDDKNLNDLEINKSYQHSLTDNPTEAHIKEVNIENRTMNYDNYPEIDAAPEHKQEFIFVDNLNDSLSEDEEPIELQEQGEQISSISVKQKFSQENTQSDKSKKKIIDINLKQVATKNKTVIEDVEMECSCKECGKNFSNYILYREHMQQEHKHSTSEVCWPCPFCDEILLSLNKLERHVRFHKQIEARKELKCPDCDNHYKTHIQLERHIRYKHKNDKLFICEKCGLRTARSSQFRQHLLIHNDFAPFECGVCKKKFKDKARMKAHVDIHGPNKYECKICGLHLSSRSTFNHHRLVHTDERRHKCDYCGKAFKRSNNLKNHLLLHTGLLLFSCNFCEKSFANRNICRRHMRKKHPKELANFDAAGNKTYTANIPKLEALKTITKAGENLKPVMSDRFGGRKKQKAKDNSEAKKSTNIQNAADSLQSHNKEH